MKLISQIGFSLAMVSSYSMASDTTPPTYNPGVLDGTSSVDWETVPEFDFDEQTELYPDLLPDYIKEQYTQGNQLLFDVRWTFESLYAMYTDEWNSYPNLNTEKGRQEALYDLRTNVACSPEFGLDYASDYFWYFHKGQVLNLEAPSCITGDEERDYRIRTYVPTTPGATYTFDFAYRKGPFIPKPKDECKLGALAWLFGYECDNDAYGSDWLEESANSVYKWKHQFHHKHRCHFRDGDEDDHDDDDYDENDQHKCQEYAAPEAPSLFVNIGGELNYFTTKYEWGQHRDYGYKTKSVTFTASKYFTPVTLQKDGEDGTPLVFLREFNVAETQSNPRKAQCEAIFPTQGDAQAYCLTGEVEPENIGCDFTQANIVWKQGATTTSHTASEQNLLSESADTFLPLGQSGNVVLRMREQGFIAACPVEGKTLEVSEVGATEFNEVGMVKVRFRGCENSDLNGGFTLLTNDLDSGAGTFGSNQDFAFSFNSDFAGCAIETIKFEDALGIFGSGAVEPYDGNGIDLNSLRLGY